MIGAVGGVLLLPSIRAIVFVTGNSTSSQIGTILNVLFVFSFLAFMVFGQQIQSRMMLLRVGGSVSRLEAMRDDAKMLTLRTLREIGKPKDDPTPRVDALLEQFLIRPEDMDPAGVVGKFDHLLDVRDVRFKSDVARMAPEADLAQLSNLGRLVEATWALNFLHKLARHLYLVGKKTHSVFIIFQLQASLPSIMRDAEAYAGATKAFAEGHPIGDGIGALVAARLMDGCEKRRIEKDMIMAETHADGRRVVVLKAEGPGGNVGKPGDGIRQIIEENGGKASMIIMIDAALKLEGEKTGEIGEGVGAAIGGIGTERFKIEEEATKFGIPLYAIIVKESLQEAVSTMSKEIANSTITVLETIKNLIFERTNEGELVLVAGIGNTIGIA